MIYKVHHMQFQQLGIRPLWGSPSGGAHNTDVLAGFGRSKRKGKEER